STPTKCSSSSATPQIRLRRCAPKKSSETNRQAVGTLGTTMINDRTEVRRILDTVKAEGRSALTAPEGKIVCEAYGIAVPREGVATSAADAAKIATAMGFPVVIKIGSPDILHKTEAGGVLVGVKSAEEAQKGYDTVVANA